MNVFIVVTHLLGTGHLSRALTIARAYRGASHTVTVASGGMPAPHLNTAGVDILQLPPLRSDGINFSNLLDADGAHAPEAYMMRRQSVLCDHLATNPPDVLITELYPFGRRSLRDEFDGLLKAAHDLPLRPLICASVRDILTPPSKPAKAMQTVRLLSQHYDAVLVHSVKAMTPLEASWPVTDVIRAKLHYTGFVAPDPVQPTADTPAKDAIVVSAGGGDVGRGLFEAALNAARLRTDLRWNLLVGGKGSQQQIRDLDSRAPNNVEVTPANPAFRQMLHHATASLSMCGYNTALDILQSGVPAVFVPFDDGAEVEQTLRANSLASQDGIAVLRNADMTPERIVSALESVISAPDRAALTNGMQGAQNTVHITTRLRAEMQ